MASTSRRCLRINSNEWGKKKKKTTTNKNEEIASPLNDYREFEASHTKLEKPSSFDDSKYGDIMMLDIWANQPRYQKI